MNCLSPSLVENLMHRRHMTTFQARNKRNTSKLESTSTFIEAPLKPLSPLILTIKYIDIVPFSR